MRHSAAGVGATMDSRLTGSAAAGVGAGSLAGAGMGGVPEATGKGVYGRRSESKASHAEEASSAASVRPRVAQACRIDL